MEQLKVSAPSFKNCKKRKWIKHLSCLPGTYYISEQPNSPTYWGNVLYSANKCEKIDRIFKHFVARDEVIHSGDKHQWMNSFNERLMEKFIMEGWAVSTGTTNQSLHPWEWDSQTEVALHSPTYK